MRAVSIALGLMVFILAFGWVIFREPRAAEVTKPAQRLTNENTVLAHGAKGDGMADDTAAIQQAVDAGGLVVFPRGVYRLTKSVTINLDRVGYTCLSGGLVARVVMAGEGPAFKFVGTHGGTAGPTTVKPNVWANERMPGIDGLEIVGEHENADGVAVSGTMHLILTSLAVRECRHGIHLTERNRNIIVGDCHLYHNRGVGLFLDHVNLHQINVTGSHISYNGDGGIVVTGGQVRNLHVSGCDLEANHGEGRPPTANILIDNTDGSNAEVAITGCTIQHTRKVPGSANVRVKGPATPVKGTDELRDGHITIVGNVMSDTIVNIHLQQTRGVTIVGNTCWTAVEHQILAEQSANIIVGSNNIDRNPRYWREENDAANAILFRECRDCTLNGLQVLGVRFAPAAITLEKCERFNLTGLTILDSENCGLLLKDVSLSRVSDCLIRHDAPAGDAKILSIKAEGGHGNMIVDNSLGLPCEISPGTGLFERNYTPKP